MPAGQKRIDDGHPTTITLALAPNVAFWEKSVTPPGFDGGGPNDTTTMRNSIWRTMAPKKLLTLTPMTFKAAYAAVVIGDIRNNMNVNQLMTVIHATGAKWTFYGYLDKFTPDEVTEGTQPTATVTIQPTNQDNTGAEVAPSYVAIPTTTTSTTTTIAE